MAFLIFLLISNRKLQLSLITQIVCFLLIMIFYWMEKVENGFDSNCNLDDYQEESLSTRIDTLNSKLITPKCLSKLHQSLGKMGKAQQQSSERNECGQRRKGGNKQKLKRTSVPVMKEKVSLQKARLYQIVQNTKGKESVPKRKAIAQLPIFTGKGILILQNGTKYQGQWIDGTLFDDVKVTYTNGEIYFGSTHHFYRHGKGNLYFSSGEKYVGYFSFGQLHGQGSLYSKQGRKLFEGEWFRGMLLHQQRQSSQLQQSSIF